MPFLTERAQNRRYDGDFLSLPDKQTLAQHKAKKLQCFSPSMTRREVLKRIEQSARAQAARDRHARTVKRIKTKRWLEVQHPPGAAAHQHPLGLEVPQIVVTAPDGEMHWLKDPNNYEYVPRGRPAF